jgi:Zn-dependent protease
MSLILPVMLAITGGPIFGGAKPVPINTSRLKYGEWGFALVAIAGPLTNLILAFIGFMIGHFTGIIYGDGLWAMVVLQFVLVNLGFMVFNLIPIPPLDGSRVLYALAPDFAREFMMKIERYGIFIVLGLVMIFGAMFSNIMLEGIFGVLRFFEWLVA